MLTTSCKLFHTHLMLAGRRAVGRGYGLNRRTRHRDLLAALEPLGDDRHPPGVDGVHRVDGRLGLGDGAGKFGVGGATEPVPARLLDRLDDKHKWNPQVFITSHSPNVPHIARSGEPADTRR